MSVSERLTVSCVGLSSHQEIQRALEPRGNEVAVDARPADDIETKKVKEGNHRRGSL